MMSKDNNDKVAEPVEEGKGKALETHKERMARQKAQLDRGEELLSRSKEVTEPGKEPGVQKVITIIKAKGEPDQVTVTQSSSKPEPEKKLTLAPVALPIKRKRRGLRTKQIRS